MVSYSPFNQWIDSSYLWITLHGDTIWNCFLSHQLGSFLGVWMGGKLYDATGDYTLVWWIGIGVSVFSTLVHLPIKEQKMQPA